MLMDQFTRPMLTAAAAIVLALGAAPVQADTFGFDFHLGSSNSSTASGSTIVGTRFTADRDLTIDTLHTNLNGGSGTMTLALQTDDGFGNPDGVDLTSGTATAAAGWHNVAVSSVNLTAGQVYHLVLRNPSGSSASRVLLGSKGDVYTYNGVTDPNAAQVYSNNNGSSWNVISLDSRATLWGVSNSSSGEGIGQAYNTAVVKNLGSNIYRGQTFTYTGAQDRYVDAITVNVTRNNNATTDDDVRLHLVEADTLNVLYSDTIIAAGSLAEGASDFFTATIAEANRPILEAGVEYLIAVESTGSSATNAYSFETARTDSGAGTLYDLDYQGTDSHHVIGVWSGAGPTGIGNDDTATLRHDSFFRLDLSDNPVPEPATLGLMGLGGLMLLTRQR